MTHNKVLCNVICCMDLSLINIHSVLYSFYIIQFHTHPLKQKKIEWESIWTTLKPVNMTPGELSPNYYTQPNWNV